MADETDFKMTRGGQYPPSTRNGSIEASIKTDTYGLVEFKETTKRSRGKFVRLSNETDPATVFDMMTEQWEVEEPRLLVSVTGGAKTLSMDPELKQNFKDGLLKVAMAPGTWVVSGGTNTGVMKLVGDAMHGTDNICIGIVTWGVIANKESLVATDDMPSGGTFPYRLGSYLIESGVFLDYNHSHFLLVDDGSEGKFGREIEFRAKFEECVMKSTSGNVPTVLLVLEGGPGTLNTVYSSVTNDSPIPCVLVKGSGRTADLLVYAIENSEEIEDEDEQHSGLVVLIESTYPEKKTEEDRNEIYDKTITCLQLKNNFTIAEMGSEMDVDDALLTALLNDRKTSSYEQLKLTILWDRADLAEDKILAPMLKWDKGKSPEELRWLMIMALAMNRIDFVKLLLGYGISIKGLLTNDVLQFLYAYRSRESTSTLKYEFNQKKYVGLSVLEEGDQTYLFKELLSYGSIDPKYCSLPRDVVVNITQRLCERLVARDPNQILEEIDSASPSATFENPFRELFFWAVLNNMLDMAQYLWAFEEESMAKALIAAEIVNNLAGRAESIDLQDEVIRSLTFSSSTFQQLAYQLLDACYKKNEYFTEKYITSELDQLPGVTCLDLAIASSDKEYVSHCCVQGILNAVWTGTINKSIEGKDIVTAFFCPFLLSGMDIRVMEDMSAMMKADGSDGDQVSLEDHAPERLTYGTFEDDDSLGDEFQYLNEEAFTKRRNVPLYKKMFLFYFRSPMVKFYTHAAGYILFMMLFAYVAMLKKTSTKPETSEYILILTVVGFIVGELYQIIHLDAPTVRRKLLEYTSDIWNKFDCLCVLLFVVAVILRSCEDTTHVGHICYAVDCSLWILRWLQVLYIHPITGPYVVMIGYMFRDMMYFLIILFVFLVAHGIAMTAILRPGSPRSQMLIYSVFHPYFNIYGELFIDRDREDDNTTRFGTPNTNSYAEPLAWVYLAVYLLIANVLLLNLLIAVFNNTYGKVMSNSSQIWKFERYGLVLEYSQQRIALFPPFSLLGHTYLFIKWILLSLCWATPRYDAGLKSSVSNEQKDKLREFESNCLIKLVREQNTSSSLSAEEEY